MAKRRSQAKVIIAGLILSLLIILGGSAIASRRSNQPIPSSGVAYIDMGPVDGSSSPAT
jgi:hypothetical protein